MSKSRNFVANLMFVATAVLWGFAFVAQCFGANHLGTFAFNGIRFVIGALSLVPVVLIFDRQSENRASRVKLLWASALAGFVLYTASALQQMGIELTQDAGKAGFITALYTVLVPVMYALFFRRRTSWNAWVGVAFAAVGLYLISVTGGISSVGLGDVVLFIGAFFWAGHIIVVDRVVNDISPLKFACGQFVFCAIFNLITVWVTGETMATADILGAGIPLLYCGIASVGAAYTLQILGQKFSSSPTQAAIILSTESVFAAIGGVIILHERMGLRGYLGCLLIFIGVILSQLVLDKKKAPGEKADE